MTWPYAPGVKIMILPQVNVSVVDALTKSTLMTLVNCRKWRLSMSKNPVIEMLVYHHPYQVQNRNHGPIPGPSGKFGWAWRLPEPAWSWSEIEIARPRNLRLELAY